MNLIPRTLMLSAMLSVAGCVFVKIPVYKKLQPELQITVLDERSQPIEGASVVLSTQVFPYGQWIHDEFKTTNADGIASFDGRREWQTEAPFMIHGFNEYHWSWCVHKTGFKTYVGGDGRNFEERFTVNLVRGESTKCAGIDS